MDRVSDCCVSFAFGQDERQFAMVGVVSASKGTCLCLLKNNGRTNQNGARRPDFGGENAKTDEGKELGPWRCKGREKTIFGTITSLETMV